MAVDIYSNITFPTGRVVIVHGGPNKSDDRDWSKWVHERTRRVGEFEYEHNRESGCWIFVGKSDEDAAQLMHAFNQTSFKHSHIWCERRPGELGPTGSRVSSGRCRERPKQKTKIRRTSVSDEDNTRLRDSIAPCWNSPEKILNLSSFLKNETTKFSFSNANFCESVLAIIKKYCSNVRTLDLSNNGIVTLEGFRSLHTCAPRLLNLNLSQNPIQSIEELYHLSQCNSLKELLVKNEPFLAECGIERIFVGQIMKYFPCLELLDGVNCSEMSASSRVLNLGNSFADENRTVSRDVVESFPLSQHVRTNKSCDTNAFNFMVKYFEFYDASEGKDRDKCADAYINGAYLSINCPKNFDVSGGARSSQSSSRVASRWNRNLCEIGVATGREHRLSLMKVGKEQIIQTLRRMPGSKHNKHDLAMDSNVVRLGSGNTIMHLSVTGIFIESATHVRKFVRNFVLVPGSTSMLISNEEFWIGHQIKCGLHVVVLGSLNDVSCASEAVSSSATSGRLSESQRDLIKRVAQHCRVGVDVARRALEAHCFDGSRAVTAIAAQIGGGR